MKIMRYMSAGSFYKNVPLDMKRCTCHWQKNPLIAKGGYIEILEADI